MGKVITFGIQKGGSGKTSTSSIVAYLLAQAGYKILAVDLDTQGNMTELLTMTPCKEFRDNSIAEALEDEDLTGRIIEFPEIPNLHLVPANDDLAAFSDYALLNFLDLDEEGRVQYNSAGRVKLLPEVNFIVKRTLDKVKDFYHFVIIDTPPNLSRITVNALCASDEVVVIFEAAKFCYNAIENFMETIKFVQENVHPDLHTAGILPNLVDTRIKNHLEHIERARDEYGDLVFENIIKRRATVGELPETGFLQDRKLFEDLSQYTEFIKELLSRVRNDG